jgi:hypothetical protein
VRYEGTDGFKIYIPSEHILQCGICHGGCALAGVAWADVHYCPHCGAAFLFEKRFDSWKQYLRWLHRKGVKNE